MSYLNRGRENDDLALSEAADWFRRIRTGPISAEEFAQWSAWLARAGNREAYDAVEKLVIATRAVDPVPWPLEAELSRDTYSGSEPVAQWRARHASPKQARLGSTRFLATAATILVAVIAGFGAWQWQGAHAPRQDAGIMYETVKGRHRTAMLPDGSRVLLGADSSIVVFYSEQRRDIVLNHGQAHFDVEKDTRRPFIVTAGSTAAQALGTQFSVQQEGGQTRVVVVSGTVQVLSLRNSIEPSPGSALAAAQDDPAIVRGGQQVSQRANGQLTPVQSVDLETATSWQTGRLRFSGERLELVLAAVNRYSDRQIVIRDGPVEDFLFTGTVFPNRIEEWLGGLERVFPVEVEHMDDRRVVVALAHQH